MQKMVRDPGFEHCPDECVMVLGEGSLWVVIRSVIARIAKVISRKSGYGSPAQSSRKLLSTDSRDEF